MPLGGRAVTGDLGIAGQLGRCSLHLRSSCPSPPNPNPRSWALPPHFPTSFFPLPSLPPPSPGSHLQVVDLKSEPGTSLSYDAIKEALEAHKPAVLFLCQGESSTGVHQVGQLLLPGGSSFLASADRCPADCCSS